MDFTLNVVKVISMMLAGLFGLIGTFKDFAADDKATRWKRLTMTGIVLTTLLSVVIQNLEYIDAQHSKVEADRRVKDTAQTLSTITDRTAGITATSSQIQQAQATMLDATGAVKEGVERGAAAQGKLLQREAEAVNSLSQLLNPIDPVGFGVSIDFELVTNTCLRPSVDQVVSYVSQHEISSDGHLVDDPATIVHRERGGKATQIKLVAGSKGLPFLRDGAQPTLWVRFHSPQWKATDIPRYPFDASYGIGFQRTAEPEKEWYRGMLPEYRDRREIEIHLDDDSTKDYISVQMDSLGVRKDGGRALRSVSDLRDTIVEVEIESLSMRACVSPVLSDLEMVWGQNYVFDQSFQARKFERIKRQNSTSFVYRTTRADFK